MRERNGYSISIVYDGYFYKSLNAFITVHGGNNKRLKQAIKKGMYKGKPIALGEYYEDNLTLPENVKKVKLESKLLLPVKVHKYGEPLLVKPCTCQISSLYTGE